MINFVLHHKNDGLNFLEQEIVTKDWLNKKLRILIYIERINKFR